MLDFSCLRACPGKRPLHAKYEMTTATLSSSAERSGGGSADEASSAALEACLEKYLLPNIVSNVWNPEEKKSPQNEYGIRLFSSSRAVMVVNCPEQSKKDGNQFSKPVKGKKRPDDSSSDEDAAELKKLRTVSVELDPFSLRAFQSAGCMDASRTPAST